MALNKYRGAALTPDARSQLQRVRELLSPHVETAILNLVDLANDTSIRCATRERANSKILTMYVDTVTLEGTEQLTDEGDDNRPIAVINVTRQDLDSMIAAAGSPDPKQLK